MDIKKEWTKFNTLRHYPNLYWHLGMLNDAKKDFNNLIAPNGELEYQYRQLPYKLTDDQKSDVRHPYTNALFVRKYPTSFVRDLGFYKEDVDLQNGRTLEDTMGDLKHNEYGLKLGQRYPLAPNTFLFDNVLQYSGLPVPARNNTLYGYIDNLPDTVQDYNKWRNEQGKYYNLKQDSLIQKLLDN